ncbi:hypothetical protein [Micromonospora mirobrigensis]|uniref:WD40-like Beta Propeller Repeat n=1 Tax=Micromonospora mirobrigensis TaxID=262898 RepID=A0A1C5AEC7_9ACTN|nr:hypothetical protein [Micromonospora mirobrigensis]SCF43431.1 hypothetical protein GA0070564_109107 [Micromonospora mirobrigensis]
MNRRTEESLRAAVRDLAGEARTAPELAGAALRRGRRLRRRRRATAAGAALAAVAVLTAPFLLLRPDPQAGTAGWVAPSGVATTAPAPTPTRRPGAVTDPTDWTRAPVALPGGWVLTGATSTGTPAEPGYALDRQSGRYVPGRYEETWAAPRGRVAAVVDYERRGELGLLDLPTGKVRWARVDQWIMTPHWSPEGSRLALTIMDKEGGFALGVLTVATGDYRTYPMELTRHLCTDQCFFTWSRDGREVALQQTDPDAPRSEASPHLRRGVQFFSADDGRPTRFVPVPGDPAGPWSWSPDGRRVVLKGPDGPVLAEVATGRVLRTFPDADAAWVDDGRLLRRDPSTNDMVLTDPAGRELGRRALPATLGLNMALTLGPR